jgi:regulator of cell morphogenesis and NO signaling
MTPVTASSTVAELVLERPARARLFERLGLDYCCGGRRPLEEACRRRGLDVETVVAALEAVDETAAAAGAADWSHAGADELVAHIVDDHHDRLREELPRISALLDKVVRAHGQERPELVELAQVFATLRGELEQHTDAEEQVLFPACRALAGGTRPETGIAAEIARLEREHAHAGELLEQMASLTGGFDAAGARCNTHRATLDALRELTADLHEHIHEENNILFPQVLGAAS